MVGIFHVKSWVKYCHLLPYLLFDNKNISCIKFSSYLAADENVLTANFSQTTVTQQLHTYHHYYNLAYAKYCASLLS